MQWSRPTLFIHSSLSLYLKYTPFISGCKKHFLSLLFQQTSPNSLKNTMRAKERTNSLVTQPDETGLSNTSTSSLSLLFSTNTSKQPTKPVRAKESQGEYKFLGSSSWWNWVVSCQLHQQVYSHFYFQHTFPYSLRNPMRTKERTNSLIAQAGESGLSTSSTSFYHFYFQQTFPN